MTGPADDEDEVVDITTFGGPPQEIPVGLERAKGRARQRFVEGRIEVEEFEAEIDRLLRKEQEHRRS